jgi:AcrR family transcriptional regulator
VVTEDVRPWPGRGEAGETLSAPSADGRRKAEILDTASQLFASSGLRTSIQEIADACGIQPGSLYHHFPSKEAIVVELIQRYHAELDHIAQTTLDGLQSPDRRLAPQAIVGLGTLIARCAVRHSAAVQFSFYEPPVGASDELMKLAGRYAPAAIKAAMLEVLRTGRSSGFIRPGIELEVLSERICQTMLHVGLGLFHRYAAVDRVASLLCDMVLHGVAAAPPEDGVLDGSSALLAVEQVLRTWNDEGDDAAGGDRAALLRRVARAEFGRRGYEVTTIRDIGAAAGVSTGSVYRAIGSKEELLTSIMSSFAQKVTAGWEAVLSSDATAVEKLDALAWLQINVQDRFNDEFKIQLAWLRQSPPGPNLAPPAFPSALRRLMALLGDGARLGELRIKNPAAELTARCVLDLTWMPEKIIRSEGTRAALIHARDTVLRGVAER